jgi:hypothetical protein
MSIHKQKLLDDIEEAINRISTTGQAGNYMLDKIGIEML